MSDDLARRLLANHCEKRAKCWAGRASELSDFINESTGALLGVSPQTLKDRRYCRDKADKWNARRKRLTRHRGHG